MTSISYIRRVRSYCPVIAIRAHNYAFEFFVLLLLVRIEINCRSAFLFYTKLVPYVWLKANKLRFYRGKLQFQENGGAM